jgi:excisionase family DNA binding protein
MRAQGSVRLNAEVLSVNEACAYMRIGRSTIYSLAKAGKLPIRKVAGRSLILRSDILSLLGVG